ncbi:pyridoxamine 5'-phosphate oxidase family protein [Polaribacter sp.]|uniref:pyridoxamine 5'-phosphate oxidase family protein n=1 Tax=Polaribacter sp. TaxID=1920175 RepID=UPI003EF6F205
MKFFLSTFLVFVLVSCTTKVEESKKDIKTIAKEIMKSAKNCALITVDSLRISHVRAMDPFLPEEDFTVWLGTNPKSEKVKQIQKNKQVSLFYFDKNNGSYVTLQGIAKLVNAESAKKKYWKKDWENFYKNRTTDYILIKFTPNMAYIISEKHKLLGDSISWKVPSIKF